jgi:5-bromo-4-chloroindolyl phosphate hydrolysis protein
MKQKDIALIIVVVVFTGIFSFIICSKFINTSETTKQEAEVVSAITSEFNVPSDRYFNVDAINPTKLIEIGPTTNDQPFVNE